MKKKNSRFAVALVVATGCLPFVASGCGDDTSGSDPGVAGTSSNEGGTSAGTAGKGNAGKGGSAEAGKNTGGTKNYAGSDGGGGDGGDAEPNAGSGGGGGKGGAGGTSGAGGKGGAGGTAGAGGKGGAGGASGNAGTSGGGAGGMSGGGAGGASGGGAGGASGGGAGGTTGGGGTGGSGGPSCGNGVVDEGESCDPEDGKYTEDDCGAVWGTGSGETGASSACKVITPLVCLMCEEQSDCAVLADSSLVMGETATAGPAMGVKRSVLYNETMDCVRDTKCANGLPIDCYCGTASSAQCDAGNGNGKCRAVIERGLETTNPADIQARYLSLDYGAGVALSRINCDQQNCLDFCFPAAP